MTTRRLASLRTQDLRPTSTGDNGAIRPHPPPGNDSDDDENVENGRDGEGEQVVFKSLHCSRTKAAVAARVANRSATAELPDVQPAAAAGPSVAGPSNARLAAARPAAQLAASQPAAPQPAAAQPAAAQPVAPQPAAANAHPAAPGPVPGTPLLVARNNDQIPVFTLVYGRNGRVRMKRIHQRLRTVIKASYIALETELYVYDAFPDSLKQNKLELLARCLRSGAQAANDHEIYHKFSVDIDWTKEIIGLVST